MNDQMTLSQLTERAPEDKDTNTIIWALYTIAERLEDVAEEIRSLKNPA